MQAGARSRLCHRRLAPGPLPMMGFSVSETEKVRELKRKRGHVLTVLSFRIQWYQQKYKASE
jgi:hypothetical protein